MRVSLLDYDLPPELIAQEPAAEREAARLLVVANGAGGEGNLTHTSIAHLADHVPSGSLIVVNDTKVIRARILGVKETSGGKAEIFLVRRDRDDEARSDEKGPQRWHAMARASKPLRVGARVVSGPLVAEVLARGEDGAGGGGGGLFLVRLSTSDGSSIDAALDAHAHVPLPPYIKREARIEDADRYQTVFAREPGAIAAPTAGLHLTRSLMKRLEEKGCEIGSCTLHVGLGTFAPVIVDDLDDHAMHAETFEVTPALVSAVSRARERNAPVLAIGTTAVRALESAADPDPNRDGHVRACAAEETRILIQPGYRFRVVDRLLTNFHLPKSTLLALVAAFAGHERVLNAYQTAVKERYRFFSYGDAMLLANAQNARAQ